MPYTISGYDSAGVLRSAAMSDAGVISGDALLDAWLADNPIPPLEGDSPTDAELDIIAQHVSKLFSVVTIVAGAAVTLDLDPTAPAQPEPEV